MLTLAPIFTDRAVLQRRKPIPVWGTAKPGQRVAVRLGGEAQAVTADGDGRWLAALPPREAGEGETLAVSCGGETLERRELCFGEVWLAGGQSNMELPLAESRGGKKAIAESGASNVRFFQAPRDGEKNSWQRCTPDTSGVLSAAAYHFARQVAEAQRVTVGIISCCYGGTSISCWMSRERLAQSAAGQRYLDDYDRAMAGRDDEEYRRAMAAYEADHRAWELRTAAYRREHPRASWAEIHLACGECPWPQPAGKLSPFYPGRLYDTMLRAVCPYALRGFLYYQGEEDCERYYLRYGEMLSQLIDLWRTDWEDDTLPFLFAQLPMYIGAAEYQAHRDDCHWAYVRDQQKKVSLTVANTGMAVLADCGELDNVHPADKETVGSRLALLARKLAYGEQVVAEGPRLQGVERAGNALCLTFGNTAGGLTVHGDLAEGFELAGADGVYHPARAEVSLDTVRVWSGEVPQPETVRYAWKNYTYGSLYNLAGLPAVPVRTDRFPI